MHTMHCLPCTNHSSLEAYDILLRKGISVIANLDLSDVQWLQASLPVKEGGLGVRRGYLAGTVCFFSVRRRYRSTPATAPTSQSDVRYS